MMLLVTALLASAALVSSAVVEVGEVYDSDSQSGDIMFGEDNRVYCLPYIELQAGFVKNIAIYLERAGQTKFQIWREFSPIDAKRPLRYWRAHEITVPAEEDDINNIMEVAITPAWQVFATDLTCFQTSSPVPVGTVASGTQIKPAMLTRKVKKPRYYYDKVDKDNPDDDIRDFNTGVWPWEWSYRLTIDTEQVNHPDAVVPTQPTEPPEGATTTATPETTTTVASNMSPTTKKDGGSRTTSDGDGNQGNGQGTKGPKTGSQTGYSGVLSELLKPGWVLALLIWCAVVTILLLVLCCCVLSKRKSEKKRKFYIDYLRRQNPYIESLRSKDYSWNDFSNGESSGGHPDPDHRSDVGIVNNEHEPRGTMRDADAQLEHNY